MSLSTGDEAAVIAVGVGALVGIGTGIFRTATLRGDMNSKWARRVAYTVAALDERTIAELEQLRDQVDELLPAGHGFDPAVAIADPAPLGARAEKTVSYYRARTRMERHLVVLRGICPVIVAGLTGLLIATAVLTASYAEILLWTWLRPAGLIALAVAVAILVVTVAVYVILQHRLAGAEILAGSGGRVDAGEDHT